MQKVINSDVIKQIVKIRLSEFEKINKKSRTICYDKGIIIRLNESKMKRGRSHVYLHKLCLWVVIVTRWGKEKHIACGFIT